MFVTDRVAIDPRFGIYKSAERYIGWIHDVIDRGGQLFSISFKSKNVGFFLFQRDQGVMKGVIGGIFRTQNYPGCGVALNYTQIIEAKNQGCHLLQGAFSSNNPSLYKINQLLGARLTESYYVFVNQ
jgi:hypothetical protein